MGVATISLIKKLGGLLVIVGLVVLGFTYWPVAQLEVSYQVGQQSKKDIVPLDTELGIVIPKIGANSKIVADVDPFDSKIYQVALTQGVAHALGTPPPGDVGNSFLFSHSSADFFLATQYNSVFYLLSKLEVGDVIYIYRNDEKLSFEVTKKTIVGAEAVDYLNSSPDGTSTITLMTCWPPGTDLKRLIVQATLVSS